MNLNHHAVRINILHILQQAGEFKMPDDALKKHLRKMLDVDLLELRDAFIDEQLKWLTEKGKVDFVVDDLAPEKKLWRITASGKATI